MIVLLLGGFLRGRRRLSLLRGGRSIIDLLQVFGGIQFEVIDAAFAAKEDHAIGFARRTMHVCDRIAHAAQ